MKVVRKGDLNLYGCVVVCAMIILTFSMFSDRCSGNACETYTKRTKRYAKKAYVKGKWTAVVYWALYFEEWVWTWRCGGIRYIKWCIWLKGIWSTKEMFEWDLGCGGRGWWTNRLCSICEKRVMGHETEYEKKTLDWSFVCGYVWRSLGVLYRRWDVVHRWTLFFSLYKYVHGVATGKKWKRHIMRYCSDGGV